MIIDDKAMVSAYPLQLDKKVATIQQQFANYLTEMEGDLQVYPSAPAHFRQRAEFRLWHERDTDGNDTGELFYAMFSPGEKAGAKTVKRINQLPIASECINALMPQLLAALRAQPILVERLFQVEFLSTLAGETLVSLIYHKPLNEDWQAKAKQLQTTLGIYLIGRSRKQKIVLTQDYVTETLEAAGQHYHYRQIEGGFTQPNAAVCEKMLTWAVNTVQTMSVGDSDLLELYCGNGNFTLPLSRCFRRVLATEVAKTSVRAARHNIAINNCDNIAIARLSAEELTQAMNGERQFKRLQEDKITINDYQFSTIFVDPPRAGVDKKTLLLMQTFQHILYISCNPQTLLDNLAQLSQTHKLSRIAVFDQFPYTNHVEMGVCLTRRPTQSSD